MDGSHLVSSDVLTKTAASAVERCITGLVVASDDRLSEAIDRSVAWLLARQSPQGHWCGEIGADSTLVSDYVLCLSVIGRADRIPQAASAIRRSQLPDGGWNIYSGGPTELNATVKAYTALRLAGDPHTAAHMMRARTCILTLGGVEATNSFTRFYLALIGAVEWTAVPAVPPELLLLPRWCGVNIYNMSSWTRAILVPLTIVYALRPLAFVRSAVDVRELYVDVLARPAGFRRSPRLVSWRNVFLVLDRLAKWYERCPWKPFRARALREARRWLFEHLERSDGLAAIFPAMMNAVFALVALGHPPTDPVTAREIEALARLEIDDDHGFRLRPCFSPVWDTAMAMVALKEAGMPLDHPALVRATRWLLDRQILASGDWRVNNPALEPGGWAFEGRNEFYPDCDDTAFVLLALHGVEYPDRIRLHLATTRAVSWLTGMQNRDGGWGAFDRDNDLETLTSVPFADHNAMIDPSTADVTARVIESLARFGLTSDHAAIRKALDYLAREQSSDGSWYGRWGVNYVYGTSGVLRAAAALKIGNAAAYQRGAEWLCRVQRADGGFGESCRSYEDPSHKGRGPATAAQTAWAVIGLLAGGRAAEAPVDRAVDYLLRTQNRAGSWEDEATTGTGFPRVFYLNYQLYPHSFPLYALAKYRSIIDGGS